MAAESISTIRRRTFTRERILNASCRLFSANGFTTTTVRDIAKVAGITDAAIYYHFSGKGELLEILLERGAGLLYPSTPAAWPDDMPPSDVILRRAVHSIESNLELFRLVLREAFAGDTRATACYHQWHNRWEAWLSRSIDADGIASGKDASMIAHQALSLALMAAEDTLMLRPDSRVDPRRRMQDLSARLISSLNHLTASRPARTATAAPGRGG